MRLPGTGQRRNPLVRLLAGLAVTLTAVAVYSGYTIVQLRGLQELQGDTIDRNRIDSLLLLRIQNSLNSLALTMRDMLDTSEPYPLTAWQAQLKRIRSDLDDAMAQDARHLPRDRTAAQREYLTTSVAQFWDALDRLFLLARAGDEKGAREMIRLSLQARQEALTTAVARLLVQNNEIEQEAATRTRGIYSRAERNVYFFVGAMLILIVLTSLYLVHYYRRLFEQVADLSERRSELARQLISIQESTLRSISRELHDEFGQILTAIGAMLQRTDRHAGTSAAEVRSDIREIQEIVQSTLEKTRTLSHALHPVVLDEAGLESALDAYLPGFAKQTGIEIQYEKAGTSPELDRDIAIQVYRILQEALNNIARHSRSPRAHVKLNFPPGAVVLEVEDDGIGFPAKEQRQGMGLISMRERADLAGGSVEFLNRAGGGAMVRLTVPRPAAEAMRG
jgi:signal transduction histidine kinase